MEENQITHQTIKEALQRQEYLQAERLAKARLDEDPLDAPSWAYLGEALMHRGYSAAAHMVFERAWLLDPEAMWRPRIQSELRKREAGSERYDIELLLLTQPVRLSAAIIVRNGEKTIERCIQSLEKAADEIVVVDYGSTDRTAEIVRSLSRVKLLQVVWQDNFAQIRNEAHKHLNGDWVIWLEADEQLCPEDANKTRLAASLFQRSEAPVALDLILLQSKNGALIETFTSSRMYPLRRGLLFEGNVYERLVDGAANDGSSSIISRKIRVRLDLLSNLVVEGGTEQTRQELLHRMLEEQPNNLIGLIHYSRELTQQGRWEEALCWVKEAENKAAMMPEFPGRIELASLKLRLLIELNRWEEAEQEVQAAILLFPDFPDFSYYLSQIHIHKAEQLYKEAEHSLNLAQQGFSTYRGPDPMDHDIAAWKSSYLMAELACDAGELAGADGEYGKLLQLFPDWDELQKRRSMIQEQRSVLQRDRKGEINRG